MTLLKRERACSLACYQNFRRCFPNISEYYDMVFDLHSQMILKLRSYHEVKLRARVHSARCVTKFSVGMSWQEEFDTLCREENVFQMLEKIEALCARNGLDSDGNIVR